MIHDSFVSVMSHTYLETSVENGEGGCCIIERGAGTALQTYLYV